MGKRTKEQDGQDESIQLVSFKKFKPIVGESNRIEVYKNTEKGKEKQRLLRISQQEVEHIATNFGEEQPSRSVKYAIGIKNPINGQVEYIEVDQPLVIRLRREQPPPKHEISRPVYDIEHKMRLVNELGTNKSRRKMNQMRNNLIE